MCNDSRCREVLSKTGLPGDVLKMYDTIVGGYDGRKDNDNKNADTLVNTYLSSKLLPEEKVHRLREGEVPPPWVHRSSVLYFRRHISCDTEKYYYVGESDSFSDRASKERLEHPDLCFVFFYIRTDSKSKAKQLETEGQMFCKTHGIYLVSDADSKHTHFGSC